MGHRKESNGGSMSMNSRQSSPSHKLHEKYEKKKKQQQLTKTDTSVLCHNLKTTNGHSDNGQQGKSVSFHVARGAVAFLDSIFVASIFVALLCVLFFSLVSASNSNKSVQQWMVEMMTTTLGYAT